MSQMTVENPRTGQRHTIRPGVVVGWGRNGSDDIVGTGRVVAVNRTTIDVEYEETVARIRPRHIRTIDSEEAR